VRLARSGWRPAKHIFACCRSHRRTGCASTVAGLEWPKKAAIKSEKCEKPVFATFVLQPVAAQSIATDLE
jgi:hypothetical protein